MRLPDELKHVSELEFESELKPHLEKTLNEKAKDLIEGNEATDERDQVTMVGIEFNLEDGADGYILAWMKCLIEAYNVILTIPKDDLQNAVIGIGVDGSECYKVEGNETTKYYMVVLISLETA